MSQEAFGKRLGVTGAGISKIESGDRGITEQMILAICREFNVNEKWLRNGEGEMFLDLSEDEFVKAAASLSNDVFVRSLIVEYWKLDDDGKKLFREFIHRLSDSMRGLEYPPHAPLSICCRIMLFQRLNESVNHNKKPILRNSINQLVDDGF